MTLQPRSQGFSLLVGGGWEKTLASAGHVTFRHLKILGVINFGLHELLNRDSNFRINYRNKMVEEFSVFSLLSWLGMALSRRKFPKFTIAVFRLRSNSESEKTVQQDIALESERQQ